MGTQLWSNYGITVRVESPSGVRTIEVDKPYVRIGSHPQAEVTLEGPGIPKAGLYLHATNDGIFCMDLQSPRHSVLDSDDESGIWLSDDRGAVLGDYHIFAAVTGSDVEQPRPSHNERPQLDRKGSVTSPVPLMVVLVNEQRRATYRVNRKLTLVGRDVPSALRLKSDFISTTHCVLYWDSGRLWFVDLLSSNGTEKRGRRRVADRLRIGKTIKLGDVRLGFVRTCDEPRTPHHEAIEEDQEPVRFSAHELAVATLSDSLGASSNASTSSSSALATLDQSDSSIEDHEAIAVTTSTESLEAIKEMQRQLEEERIEWEEAREEQQRTLERRYHEVDKHFAEIQSWRAELDTRSGQLDNELNELARSHAELDKKRHDISASIQQLEQRELTLQQQLDTLQQQQSSWTLQRSEQQEDLQRQRDELTQQAAALAAAQQQLESKHQQLADEQQQLADEQQRLKKHQQEATGPLEASQQNWPNCASSSTP